MEAAYTQYITTLLVLLVALGIRIAMNLIFKRPQYRNRNKGRIGYIKNVVNSSLILISALLILGIWEVEPDDIALYFTSVFTVIGVAFFAQWSHLSNLTAGIILFFNSPAKMTDTIVLMDGDNSMEGKIVNLGPFFTTLKTNQHKKVLISNSQMMQKTIGIKMV